MTWTKISLTLAAAVALCAAAAVRAADATDAKKPAEKATAKLTAKSIDDPKNVALQAAEEQAKGSESVAVGKQVLRPPLMGALGGNAGQEKRTGRYQFWGLVPTDGMPQFFWAILAMPIAALLGAAIGYHPLRIKNIGVKKEESEIPKALILIAVAGAVICGIVRIEATMAFALFGFGSFIRFRTQVKNPKETVVIFICGGLGCLCGLQEFDLAISGTAFVWFLIWILDRRSGGSIERLTVILKGFGPECQVAVKGFKEKLENAGVEVVSSKVSLKKGNVTILMDKDIRMTIEQLEEILLAGDEVTRPKSIEWIKGE